MELFTLLVNPAVVDAENVTEAMREAVGGFLMAKSRLELRRVPLTGGTGIVCDISPLNAEVAQLARAKAAGSLAKVMVEAYEYTLVERLIAKELGVDNKEGAEAVRSHCAQLLNGQSGGQEGPAAFMERRISKLAGVIDSYLAEDPFLHVEGFLRFRARQYLEELRDTVAYAVDEWLMERQYQEFITLLKYFVYLQEEKIPAAHVVHSGSHHFTLLNERMMPIDMKQMDQFIAELIDNDINYEDVIVSTLISVSPGKLYVHSKMPEEQIIKTILTIFEDRAELCTSCQVCLRLEDQKRK